MALRATCSALPNRGDPLDPSFFTRLLGPWGGLPGYLSLFICVYLVYPVIPASGWVRVKYALAGINPSGLSGLLTFIDVY